MSHCYLIDLGRSGGEVTLHPVDNVFVEYWMHQADWALPAHTRSGFTSDEQSPPVSADDPEDWQALPQWASVYGATEDGTLTVHEITLNGGALIVNGAFMPDPSLGFFQSFTRGEYVQEIDLADAKVRQDVSQPLHQSATAQATLPTLSVRTLESGPFACAFLRIEQPFDPEKIEVGFIGTHFQQVVNSIWYDGAQLDLVLSDDISEMTGIHCDVGYIDPDEPPLGRSE